MLAASISRREKPSAAEQVESGRGEVLGRDVERVAAEVFAQRPFVEHELDVEGGRQRLLDFGDRFVGEALGLQGRVVDGGRLRQPAVADGVGLDLGDVGFRIAERAQRLRHRAVDDLEVAAAGQLLELDQREVGLDAGGVAVHHQADGAGRRDHGRLRVAVAVLLAEIDGPVPGGLGVRRQLGKALQRRAVAGGERGVVERHRRDRHLLVALRLAVSRAAMIAHHAQHGLAVLLVAGEGPELAGHFRRGGVGNAGHDGGKRAGNGAAGRAVIGDARGHQAARRYWRSRGRACGIRRTARRSGARGIAPSSPRFPARSSTAAPRARRRRRRTCRS